MPTLADLGYNPETDLVASDNIAESLTQIQMEQMLKRWNDLLNEPFDETEEFRDYIVWLCGYTERKTPPTKEEWSKLRDKTKKIAAKFALAVKDRGAERLRQVGPYQQDLFGTFRPTTTTLGTGGPITTTGSIKTTSDTVTYKLP